MTPAITAAMRKLHTKLERRRIANSEFSFIVHCIGVSPVAVPSNRQL
jgi:hypothetical protein